MKYSIILIHYKASNLIISAIESVIKNSGTSLENLEFVIINNSQDLNIDYVKKMTVNCQIIEPGYNSGFARAINMGLKAASKDYICIMNQDASIMTCNSFGLLAEKAKSLPEKTILGCSLIDENGNYQQSVWIDDPGILREWKKGPINCKLNPSWKRKFNHRICLAHSSSSFVHRINGAFLFLKKPDSIKDVFFDEDFFLYGEDIEWANRIKRKNWKFYHYNEVQVKHIGSASSSSIEPVKHNQIEIMDWLSILKMKGRFYLILYLNLLVFNKRLDYYLAIRAKSNKTVINKLKNKILLLIEKKRFFLKMTKTPNNHSYFEVFNLYKNPIDVVE